MTQTFAEDRLYNTLGSSPERLMSWRRDGKMSVPSYQGYNCEERTNMTREKAGAILNTPKDRGENLMIVYLILHDLN
jgi:para-aminobenzoate synthetase